MKATDSVQRVPLSAWELAGIAAFWSAIAIFSVINAAEVRRGNGVPPAVLVVVGQSVAWAFLTPLVFVAARRFRFERDAWVTSALVLVALGILAGMVTDTTADLLRGFLHIRIRRGGWNPLQAMEQRGAVNTFVIYCGVLAAGVARDMAERLRIRQHETLTLIAQRASLEAKLAATQLEAIQLQLQPHFLFNTLNAVSGLLERDPAGARKLLAQLSDLLRLTLQAGTKSEVVLSKDLAIVERYLALLKGRFPDKLQCSIDATPEALLGMVPSLLLQPLVENAWRHGVDQIDKPGLISISALRAGDMLVLKVANTGPEISNGHGTGIGLSATRERLEALYETRGRFRLFREGPLTIAEVVLPYKVES